MKRSLKEIRKAAGASLARVAAAANVSEPTARIFEAAPDAVADPAKRKALADVYSTIEKTGALSLRVAS